jgi:hypothetical protein
MVSEHSTMSDSSTNSGSLSNENFLSPFFLHHGDSPGAVLVSQTLNDNNYSTWRRSMKMALTAKNKLGFIDGTIPKPSSTDTLFHVWTRCNTMVFS